MGKWLAVFDNHGDVVASISKRPDLSEINNILDEEGDEIFKDADSIALEIDMEKDTIKRVFKYAEKYNLKVYAAVSNMSIAVERRDFLKNVECFVCNQQEAGILFMDDYSEKSPEEMQEILSKKIQGAQIKKMIVTLGGQGAVYADIEGNTGFVPARKVDVKDTTGAGDSFFAGVTIGLTYGKTIEEACEIGSTLAASVIVTSDNVCPRFLPSEFGIEVNN
jgi:pseudouridine kinase